PSLKLQNCKDIQDDYRPPVSQLRSPGYSGYSQHRIRYRPNDNLSPAGDPVHCDADGTGLDPGNENVNSFSQVYLEPEDLRQTYDRQDAVAVGNNFVVFEL